MYDELKHPSTNYPLRNSTQVIFLPLVKKKTFGERHSGIKFLFIEINPQFISFIMFRNACLIWTLNFNLHIFVKPLSLKIVLSHYVCGFVYDSLETGMMYLKGSILINHSSTGDQSLAKAFRVTKGTWDNLSNSWTKVLFNATFKFRGLFI